MIIDVQCHIFPQAFIKELTRPSCPLSVNPPDKNGRCVVYDRATGDELSYFVENSPHTDAARHLEDMEKYGVSAQILSLPPPSVDKADATYALRLSRLINDDLASLVAKHKGKFLGLASIPMQDPKLAEEEIDRAINDLGLSGSVISSNTAGNFYDSPEYVDVFRRFEKYNAPVFIHPTNSVAWKQIGQDYKLGLIYGWPFDTTLSVSRLVFSGLYDKVPNLKLIAAHGGGMIPFFAGRIDMLSKVAAGGGKPIVVNDSVSVYRRKVYYDTAIFNSDSIDLLVKFAGAENVLYASDYPFGQNFGRDCYEKANRSIEQLDVSEDVKQGILWKNAARLFKIKN